MKLFHAIDDADLIPVFYKRTGIKLNIMISYSYIGGQFIKLTKDYRSMFDLLYLDSGAFTVSAGGSRVKVAELLCYIKSYGSHFDAVFNLDDKFDDPGHNLMNQLHLEEKLPDKLRWPIPVVHSEEDPFGELEQYAEMGHTYVAIGSNKMPPDEVFNKIKATYPAMRLHMFGNLNRRMLFTHRPYSADSASWAANAGYGNILYWDPIDKKEVNIYLGGRNTPKGIHINKYRHKKELTEYLLMTFGYTHKDLLSSSLARQIVNIHYFTLLEAQVNSSP